MSFDFTAQTLYDFVTLFFWTIDFVSLFSVYCWLSKLYFMDRIIFSEKYSPKVLIHNSVTLMIFKKPIYTRNVGVTRVC